jgi:RNA polymerase sigma-70 factor, ECF subfamily
MSATPSIALVDHLFRSRAGQMVAYLTRSLGPQYLDLAEEVVQEALLKALQIWPYSGVPRNPSGWLFRVARNAALDAIRHTAIVDQKAASFAASEIAKMAASTDSPEEAGFEEQLRDDELRMVLMCCHPALPRDARIALSLKTVGGFSTREIARAFLSDESTIAQRLVRAKRQIRKDGIAFDLPREEELIQRLDSALEVIYLMFNEGYAAQSGENLVRQELCGEALRIARLLAASSVATPETHALVALMAFQAARLPARVDSQGDVVLLEDQDRSVWDARLVALGFQHFSQCAEGPQISVYHLQAAIAAIHARAELASDTNWPMILQLYTQLLEQFSSPVVALNRIVAVAKVNGTEQALSELHALASAESLQNYYLLPAVEGSLLLEMGDKQEAARSFRRALELPCSDPEKRFLQRKLVHCLEISPAEMNHNQICLCQDPLLGL